MIPTTILPTKASARTLTLNLNLERPDLMFLALHREGHALDAPCSSKGCILGWIAVSPQALRDICEAHIQGAEASVGRDPASREHDAFFPTTVGTA